ncbi:MAG: hypothetical protein M1834_008712 [Cirrosporium novae-zelandiae]|nr:MAG: hypothetical protein M1834_008712 [Cirrosporium novae-zelandiae]
MKPTFISAALSASILLASKQVLSQSTASASSTLVLSAMTYEGCFDDAGPLVDQGSYTYQSPGYCQTVCVKLNKAVMGLKSGSNCWCGNLIPANSSYVSESKCDSSCDGYDKDICGGSKTWSVYLTGVDNGVGYADSDSTSTDGATKTTKGSGAGKTQQPSVITAAGKTIVITASSQASDIAASESASKAASSGTNKAGIAAGVVVGVVVLGAAAGGAFFYLRMRKRRQVEEEYRRNAAENPFTGKIPPSTAMSDSRLDPSIASYRRQSVGSIADEQDFSRRILKVTNPDGS